MKIIKLTGEILSYATELLPMLREFTVISQRVPINKSYYYATIDERALTIIEKKYWM